MPLSYLPLFGALCDEETSVSLILKQSEFSALNTSTLHVLPPFQNGDLFKSFPNPRFPLSDDGSAKTFLSEILGVCADRGCSLSVEDVHSTIQVNGGSTKNLYPLVAHGDRQAIALFLHSVFRERVFYLKSILALLERDVHFAARPSLPAAVVQSLLCLLRFSNVSSGPLFVIELWRKELNTEYVLLLKVLLMIAGRSESLNKMLADDLLQSLDDAIDAFSFFRERFSVVVSDVELVVEQGFLLLFGSVFRLKSAFRRIPGLAVLCSNPAEEATEQLSSLVSAICDQVSHAESLESQTKFSVLMGCLHCCSAVLTWFNKHSIVSSNGSFLPQLLHVAGECLRSMYLTGDVAFGYHQMLIRRNVYFPLFDVQDVERRSFLDFRFPWSFPCAVDIPTLESFVHAFKFSWPLQARDFFSFLALSAARLPDDASNFMALFDMRSIMIAQNGSETVFPDLYQLFSNVADSSSADSFNAEDFSTLPETCGFSSGCQLHRLTFAHSALEWVIKIIDSCGPGGVPLDTNVWEDIVDAFLLFCLSLLRAQKKACFSKLRDVVYQTVGVQFEPFLVHLLPGIRRPRTVSVMLYTLNLLDVCSVFADVLKTLATSNDVPSLLNFQQGITSLLLFLRTVNVSNSHEGSFDSVSNFLGLVVRSVVPSELGVRPLLLMCDLMFNILPANAAPFAQELARQLFTTFSFAAIDSEVRTDSVAALGPSLTWCSSLLQNDIAFHQMAIVFSVSSLNALFLARGIVSVIVSNALSFVPDMPDTRALVPHNLHAPVCAAISFALMYPDVVDSRLMFLLVSRLCLYSQPFLEHVRNHELKGKLLAVISPVSSELVEKNRFCLLNTGVTFGDPRTIVKEIVLSETSQRQFCLAGLEVDSPHRFICFVVTLAEVLRRVNRSSCPPHVATVVGEFSHKFLKRSSSICKSILRSLSVTTSTFFADREKLFMDFAKALCFLHTFSLRTHSLEVSRSCFVDLLLVITDFPVAHSVVCPLIAEAFLHMIAISCGQPASDLETLQRFLSDQILQYVCQTASGDLKTSYLRTLTMWLSVTDASTALVGSRVCDVLSSCPLIVDLAVSQSSVSPSDSFFVLSFISPSVFASRWIAAVEMIKFELIGNGAHFLEASSFLISYFLRFGVQVLSFINIPELIDCLVLNKQLSSSTMLDVSWFMCLSIVDVLLHMENATGQVSQAYPKVAAALHCFASVHLQQLVHGIRLFSVDPSFGSAMFFAFSSKVVFHLVQSDMISNLLDQRVSLSVKSSVASTSLRECLFVSLCDILRAVRESRKFFLKFVPRNFASSMKDSFTSNLVFEGFEDVCRNDLFMKSYKAVDWKSVRSNSEVASLLRKLPNPYSGMPQHQSGGSVDSVVAMMLIGGFYLTRSAVFSCERGGSMVSVLEDECRNFLTSFPNVRQFEFNDISLRSLVPSVSDHLLFLLLRAAHQ
eukprot:ANDGO_00980.mRNA.1 hypothetical protein